MSNSTTKSKSCLTAFCFFSIGVWFSYMRYILLSATEDILAGTLLSSTIVLISYSVPDVAAKILSPFIVKKIQYLTSILLFLILLTVSAVLMVVIESAHLRLPAIVLCGFCNGFGVIVFARMMAHYDNTVQNVSSFQLGSNCSTMIGSLIYTGMTTWLCISPRTTIASSIPVCWLVLVFYAIMDKEPLKTNEPEKHPRNDQVSYAPLPTTDEEAPYSTMNKIARKLDFFFQVFPYLSYFFLSFFITYISMNSIVTSLIFPSAPFLPRDHYQYYRLLSDAGIFLGGTELFIVTRLSPNWQSFFNVRRIWIPVLLNVGHLFFFIFASWYHFVSQVGVILALCFTQGFLHGSISVRSLASSTDAFESASDKGTALGIVEVGSSLGRLSSGLIGMYVEMVLREHCTNDLLLGEKFCLTRFMSASAWAENRLDCSF